MIEFPCIYCGRPVRAEESATYQQVPCPACGHAVPVRRQKPAELPHEAPRVGSGADWSGKSNEEIAEQLLSRTRDPEERAIRGVRKLLAPLLPQYDDLTLFTLSLAFLLLLWIDETSRQDLLAFLHARHADRTPVLFLFLGFGIACSLIGVFWRRKRSEFEKGAMLFFAVLVTAGTGIYAGWLMLGRSPGWLIVFPAWNILNGALLLLLTHARIIDTECIVDDKATFGQVVVTALAVPLLLTTCRYLFELHWATTFSIAAAYTLNLHNVLRHRAGLFVAALTGRRK
jgi:DNA-directed RNA polymerase subunit RPC12/RpoP